MAVVSNALRRTLYIFLFLFGCVEFGLAGFRLKYTTHLPRGDPLNGGNNFFDPIVAELLFASFLAIIFSPIMLVFVRRRKSHRRMIRRGIEVILLLGLWIFWLVGAAIATSIWPNLSFCNKQFQACRILTTLVAFSWIGWITISVLLILAIRLMVHKRRRYRERNKEEHHHHL